MRLLHPRATKVLPVGCGRGRVSDVDRIDSEETLEAWLTKQQKHEWSAAIALRAALRVMPVVLNPRHYRDQSQPTWLPGLVLRLLAKSAGAGNYPPDEIGNTVHIINGGIIADGAADAAADAANLAAHYAAEATEVAYGADAADAKFYIGRRATLAAAYAASAAARAASVWKCIRQDCALLAADPDTGLVMLHRQPLWPNKRPKWFAEEFAAMRNTLLGLEAGFDLWINWYDRRLAGRTTLFTLPRDADIEMIRRLFGQEKLGREPALVNAEIKGWLDELTPDVQAARLETILTRIEAGYQPDFSTPEAKAALETLEAAIADAAPQPGSNFFETDDVLPGDADPPPPALPPPPAIPVEVQAKLVELEEAVKVPQPDARKLGRIATWIKNKLEDWRTVSPKGMEKFEEEMGSSAAKLVRWGALGVGALVIANLSGVLDALLSYLEAALAIVRPVIGL